MTNEEVMAMETAETVMGVFLAFYAIVILIALGIWVAVKCVEMNFAKKCGARLYGLVWIPYARECIFGQIADMYKDKKARVWYVIVTYASHFILFIGMFVMEFVVLGQTFNMAAAVEESEEALEEVFFNFFSSFLIGISVIGLLALIPMIYQFVVMHRIISLKDKANASLWTTIIVIGTFLGFGGFVFFLFLCANMNKPNIPAYAAEAPVDELPEQITEEATEVVEAAPEVVAEDVVEEATAEAVEEAAVAAEEVAAEAVAAVTTEEVVAEAVETVEETVAE